VQNVKAGKSVEDLLQSKLLFKEVRMRADVCVCVRMPAYACVCLRMPAYACVCQCRRACTRLRMHACMRACMVM
jgi:hypothetical protein